MAELLRDSLAVLGRDMPSCHDRLALSLAAHALSCRVDDERFSVTFSGGGPVVGRWRRGAALEIEVPRQVVRRLLDGETTLRDALLTDELRVRGAVGALLALTDGLTAYLDGAVRSAGFPDLLRRFREVVSPAPQ
jgi:hypothetical protein